MSEKEITTETIADQGNLYPAIPAGTESTSPVGHVEMGKTGGRGQAYKTTIQAHQSIPQSSESQEQ